MAWRVWSVMAMVVCSGFLSPTAASAQGAVVGTLSVLAAPVDRVPSGGVTAEPGASGTNLAEGDRIKTGPGGLALITFLNGSTVTVLSGTEVTVRQAGAERGMTGIRMLIHAGRVWARVAQVAGSRSTLTLESNEYSATANDGLIGAEQSSEGFVCWTRRGLLHIAESDGRSVAVLNAGQRAWSRFKLPVNPEPFVPSASVIEIKTWGPVVPLVRMPEGQTAAGFLAEDVEVNQVFGSLTQATGGPRWLVEVPGGVQGTYTLVLTGVAEGPFTVRVAAKYAGFPVYREEIKGTVGKGERFFTRITQTVKGDDPRTARVKQGTVEELQTWTGEEPPAVVASPEATNHPVN